MQSMIAEVYEIVKCQLPFSMIAGVAVNDKFNNCQDHKYLCGKLVHYLEPFNLEKFQLLQAYMGWLVNNIFGSFHLSTSLKQNKNLKMQNTSLP